MEDKYGFIYITTNLVNGKKYIGQKKIDNKYKWKSYLGSGLHFKKALEKYGKHNFEREIIAYAKDLKELNELEEYYIKKYDAVNSRNFYNMIHGGTTMDKMNKNNCIPVVNIDTGYVFKSIKEASEWSGFSEVFVKKSFDYKHNIKSKAKELIFKKLDSVKFNHKLCKCCASNIHLYNKSDICEKCMSDEEFDIKDFNKFILHKTEECHNIDDVWVKNYTKKNKIKKEKYYKLNKPFECKNRKKEIGVFKRKM